MPVLADVAGRCDVAASRHWVFDMDGTLTEPVHDFELIRRELQIPSGADILEHLASLPAQQAADSHAWLIQHERELARSVGRGAGSGGLDPRAACRWLSAGHPYPQCA